MSSGFNYEGREQCKEGIKEKGRVGRKRSSRIGEAERGETKCPGRDMGRVWVLTPAGDVR